MKWNNWLFMNYIRHIERYDHSNWCWAEMECGASVEGFGAASLSRIVSSLNLKSVFEKRRLQTYCLDNFSAHSWSLCKKWNQSPKQSICIIFFSFPILILIMWTYRNTRKGSHYCRYEGLLFEETMLVKVLGFTDDAKKGFLHVLHIIMMRK